MGFPNRAERRAHGRARTTQPRHGVLNATVAVCRTWWATRTTVKTPGRRYGPPPARWSAPQGPTA